MEFTINHNIKSPLQGILPYLVRAYGASWDHLRKGDENLELLLGPSRGCLTLEL